MVFIRPYQESDFEAFAHICRATLPPSLSTTPIIAKLAPYVWTHQYTHLSPSTCHVLVDDDSTTTTSSASGSGGGAAAAVVGYCIGCPDVFTFAERYPSYVTSVLSTAVPPPPPLQHEEATEPFWIPDNDDDTTTGPLLEAQTKKQKKKPNPAALVRMAHDPRRLLGLDQSGSLSARWRATMHIDLLPAYQGRGWGRRLIEAYVRSVRASGADYGEGAWIGIAPDNAGVVRFYEKVGFRLVTTTPAGIEEGGDGGVGGEDGINMVIDIAKA